MTKARRKSVDSSESSDSSDSSYSSKHPKDKKDKDKKKKDDKHKEKEKSKDKKKDKKDKHDQYGHANDLRLPEPAGGSHTLLPPFSSHPPHIPVPVQTTRMSFPQPGDYQQEFRHGQPPPPSGYRIPSATNEPFPDPVRAGEPPFHDLDGSPIFIGSAIMENSVHPCKIGPNLHNYVSVPYGGGEHAHEGRYDLLPFRPHEMEWVPTSYGQIPEGRRPVEGGYEEGGEKLYHAAAVVYDVRVPGKAGHHLGGARVSFGGGEHEISEDYEILCWRF